MSIDDKQLDELLRQVEIPAGLKARLSSISELEVENTSADDSHVVLSRQFTPSSYGHRGWFALVASVAAISLFCLAMWFDNKAPSITKISGTEPNARSQIVVTTPEDGEPTIEILEARLAELRSLSLAAEISHLDDQLREQSTNSNDHANALSASEASSLCIALAADSAIASGLDVKLLEGDLQLVLDQFPDSAGAKLAIRILSNN